MVYYASANMLRHGPFSAIVGEVAPDVVYLNSFFSPSFSIKPLLWRRYRSLGVGSAWVIAPRGEFSPKALAIKATKKKAFMAFARLTGLHRGLVWQASGEHEAADIVRVCSIHADRIAVAPNLTDNVDPHQPAPAPVGESGRLSVCFLARICAMKNLTFVIETLLRCRSGTDLHIYGPAEDQQYLRTCRELLNGKDSRLRVTWHGPVPHDRVRDVLASHDVFFLPTLGENFGHGIFEALAAGVPALISDRTPWRDLDAAGAGWVRSLDDAQAFVDVIDNLATMPIEERSEMRRNARQHSLLVAGDSRRIEANRQLFRLAIGRRQEAPPNRPH